MNYSLAQLVLYMLRLGSLGFGGPVALAGYMHRDLVETRRWIAEADYREGLALAPELPGRVDQKQGAANAQGDAERVRFGGALVNLRRIENVEDEVDGRLIVRLARGPRVEISRRQSQRLRKLLSL